MPETETFYDRIRQNQNTTDPKPAEQPVPEKEEPTNTAPVLEQEPVKETTQTEEPKPKEVEGFDVGTINEYYGTSFENADSLKTIFDSQDKYKDFDTQLASKDEELLNAQQKYNALLEAIDPEKVLPNKEAAALSQLAEKYPNADVGMLASIRKSDLVTLDKLEALVMLDKLNVPSSVSDTVRKAEILRSLNIEETEVSELSENDRYRIEREFTSKAQQLEEIKGFQPEFKAFDFEAERTQRQQQLETERKSLLDHNEKALKILLDGYKETKSTYKDSEKDRAFAYQVEDTFKQEFFNDMLTKITDSGLKITPENANEIGAEIDNLYWLQNRHKIVKDAVKQALSGNKEELHTEIHSDSPTNNTEAPTKVPEVPKTVMEQYRSGGIKKR